MGAERGQSGQVSDGGTTTLQRLLNLATPVAAQEVRAVLLAFACNFVLLGSYYILRPIRDVMATVYGVEKLPYLFLFTFLLTSLCAPLYSGAATRFRLTRFLPGLFVFWLLNILVFFALFRAAPENRTVVAVYYTWFSVSNLFMISVFWSLMADLFVPEQATRLFALIAAGGSLGAIAGPLITRHFVGTLGIDRLLALAAGGFAVLIGLVLLLVREKARLHALGQVTQASTLSHPLTGNPFTGFAQVWGSSYMRSQSLFMLMMTWTATVAYFVQTDVIAHAFPGLTGRTQAIADIDLVVNISSALVLIFGLGRYVQRFGVTAALVLNPVLMLLAFAAALLSPSLLMVQALQAIRRIIQYAIARPSREICFTVVPQDFRYQAKNVIDTVVYRLGDITGAGVQRALAFLGVGLGATLGVGAMASVAWGGVAWVLGRQYEQLRTQQAGPRAGSAPAEDSSHNA
jgi:AAA family ATP:ADP antiporter